MINYPLTLRLILIVLWSAVTYIMSIWVANDHQVQLGLFLLLLCAGLWMTEILPLAVTALLVPVFAWALQVLDAKSAMAPFASTIVFLFMGGFTLAALLNKHGIDRWLAFQVMRLAGGRLWLSIISFLAVTFFLSMWISNTATTAMMLPIALGLVSEKNPAMRTMIVLGTAYAASIGGLATVVGSPPNGIAVAALQVDFMGWLKVGLPTALIMFPLAIIILKWLLSPEKEAELADYSGEHYTMVWTTQAKITVALFIFTVCCWVFSSQLEALLGVKQSDRMIAILITALAPALGLISWKNLEKKIDWGILLLFGGGLCLSLVLEQTGTSQWIASSMMYFLADAPEWVVIFSGITLMIILTEFASNTGSAAVFIPIMLALAKQFNPAITYALVFGVSLAATCAFMLPVATPPNALAYATGCVTQRQMLKAGAVLNCAGVVVVYMMVTILLR